MAKDSGTTAQLKVLVPLAQDCEELEAITITDLLTRAGMLVTTVGLDSEPVKASRGMVLLPNTTIDAVMELSFDLMVLPGGLPGATHLQTNKKIQSKLKAMAEDNKIVAAICAAPKALASAGLLKNKRYTCYPGSMGSDLVDSNLYSESNVVIDGNIVTSRGPGTAMDFALSLIEILLGKDKRLEVEMPLLRSN